MKDENKSQRPHLRVVSAEPSGYASPEDAGRIRPKTMGRLIAETAQLAESALQRKQPKEVREARSFIGERILRRRMR